MNYVLKRWLTRATILCAICGSVDLVAQEPESGPPPVRVVVQFLQLSEPQLAALLELRQEAGSSLDQLHREVLVRKQRLEEVLQEEEPSPAEVGALVVQISSLERAVAQVHASFIEGFAATLEPEQQARLQAVVQARQVQGVLPAFAALGLVP